MAVFDGEVAPAEEEAVDSVWSVLAYGFVVETIFTSGIGGKGREEMTEIGLVGTVEREGGLV